MRISAFEFEAAAGDDDGLAADVLDSCRWTFTLTPRHHVAVVDQRDAARAVADLDAVLLGELEMLLDQARAAALGFHREAAPELELAVDQIGLAAPDRVELHALAVQPAHRVARAADQAVAQVAVGAVLRDAEHVVVELVLGVGAEVGAVDLVLGQVRHDRLEVVDAVVDAAERAGGEARVAAHQLLRRALDHQHAWRPSRAAACAAQNAALPAPTTTTSQDLPATFQSSDMHPSFRAHHRMQRLAGQGCGRHGPIASAVILRCERSEPSAGTSG